MFGKCWGNVQKMFGNSRSMLRNTGAPVRSPAFCRIRTAPDHSPKSTGKANRSPYLPKLPRPHAPPTARSPNTSQRAPYGPNVSNVPILFRTFARPSFKITPLPKSPPPERLHPGVGGEARGRLQTSVRSSASENPMAALRKMPLPLPAPRRTTRSPEETGNRPHVKSPARSENKPQSNFQSHFPPPPAQSDSDPEFAVGSHLAPAGRGTTGEREAWAENRIALNSKN